MNPPANLIKVFDLLSKSLTSLSMREGRGHARRVILLRHEDILYAWIAGLDYDYNRDYGVYYALNYETLRLAHEWSVHRVEMGRGMYDFKIRLGFDPVLFVAWLQTASETGEELLETGIPTLQAASRTRERVLAAYQWPRREPKPPWAEVAALQQA